MTGNSAPFKMRGKRRLGVNLNDDLLLQQQKAFKTLRTSSPQMRQETLLHFLVDHTNTRHSSERIHSEERQSVLTAASNMAPTLVLEIIPNIRILADAPILVLDSDEEKATTDPCQRTTHDATPNSDTAQQALDLLAVNNTTEGMARNVHRKRTSDEQGPREQAEAESRKRVLVELSDQVLPRRVPSTRSGMELLPGVYSLPHDVTTEELHTLASFLTIVADHVTQEARAGMEGVVTRDHGRLEVDLGFLRGLRRSDPRLRTTGQHPLLQHTEKARSTLLSIEALLKQCRTALMHIGVQDTEQWSYYAYALVSAPNTPAQHDHQDCGTQRGLRYVTCLLPLSEKAELTQFASDGNYLSFPGLIMFDGRVWHRGPRVGRLRRLVLSLVACAGSDINHNSSTPFRNRADDWSHDENVWHQEAIQDSLQQHRKEAMTLGTSLTYLENKALVRSYESGCSGVKSEGSRMEGTQGTYDKSIAVPGVNTKASDAIDNISKAATDSRGNETNNDVRVSNNNSKESESSRELNQIPEKNNEVTVCVSACSKASDLIERSQPTDNRLETSAGGCAGSNVRASHNATVNAKTSGHDAQSPVWSNAGASGEAVDDIGACNITNSCTGRHGDAGNEFGSTEETRTRRGKWRDTTCVASAASTSALNAACTEKQRVVSAGDLQAWVPKDIFEAEQKLKIFDLSTRWGPSSSLTRFERITRGRKLIIPAPVGWDWVDDILCRFPALGSLKASEQYKALMQATESMSELEAPLTRAVQKMARTPRLALVTRKATQTLFPQRCSNQPLRLEKPGESEVPRKHLFNSTLQNDGNTCFFNTALQVVASIPAFRAEIEAAPLPLDHADSSYCLAFLKLFIPAIATPSSESSKRLDITSVKFEGRTMSTADWLDFVLRLTTKFDTRYVIGAFADPGDLLNYFLSIVPVAGQMCTMELTWTTTFPCACQAEWKRERRVSEQEIMISVDSEAPLIHHVLAAFNPETVTDYGCDQCQSPATRQRLLTSPPRFLRINIVTPMTSAAVPLDYHKHGELLEYDTLDLSPVTQNGQAHYT